MNNQITLRQLQLLELKIAKEFKRICEEENLKYFLIGGTLLGAVRHHGFIPWDDDMDFGMPVEDYEKFLKVAPKHINDEFILQTCDDESDYPLVFSKIRLRDTVMEEIVSRDLNMEKGVWIDIFPYDPVPEAVAKSKAHFLKLQITNRRYLLACGYRFDLLTNNKISKLLNRILRMMPSSKEALKQKIDKLTATPYNGDKTYCIERDGIFKGTFVFPKRIFDKTVELDFEDTKFDAPEKYEEYLTIVYGDYMQLPPESERAVGHSLVNVYLDEKYTQDNKE